VTFFCAKQAAEARSAFQAAHIEVTVRGGQVRVAPALFNNADEIERCLEVAKQLI
jgi:selenocysteine lyase/cysteine desulfurase